MNEKKERKNERDEDEREKIKAWRVDSHLHIIALFITDASFFLLLSLIGKRAFSLPFLPGLPKVSTHLELRNNTTN